MIGLIVEVVVVVVVVVVALGVIRSNHDHGVALASPDQILR